jgi:hypothetical protein
MKNIPIVILNRDRLYPLIEQVEALHKRNYNNIIVIDNQSTYEPLLEWYKTSGIDVFYNNLTENSCHAFRDLVSMNHPKFIEIISNWYIFNDSDIIPSEGVPDDFIEHLMGYAKNYNKSKVYQKTVHLDLTLNQYGVNNEISFHKSNSEIKQMIQQVGDSNFVSDFSINSNYKVDMQINQQGNNLTLFNNGTNSISKEMKITQNGNFGTIFIYNR